MSRKKLCRPDRQSFGILHERLHFLPGLIDMQFLDCIVEKFRKFLLVQGFPFFPMPALYHSLLQMALIKLWMVGDIPYEIVPVTGLDPALPLPAQDGMHLPGKEIGKQKGPDGERNGLKKVFIFRAESRRGVCVRAIGDSFQNCPQSP